VVALWQFCDKSEYSSYLAGGLACASVDTCMSITWSRIVHMPLE